MTRTRSFAGAVVLAAAAAGATVPAAAASAAAAGPCPDGVRLKTTHSPGGASRDVVRLCEGARQGPVLLDVSTGKPTGPGRPIQGPMVKSVDRGGGVVAVGIRERRGDVTSADVRVFSVATRRLLYHFREPILPRRKVTVVAGDRGEVAWSTDVAVRLLPRPGTRGAQVRVLAETGGAWLALLEGRTLRWGTPFGGTPLTYLDLTPPPVADGCPVRTHPRTVLDTPALRVTQDEVGEDGGGDYALRVCDKAAAKDAVVGSGQFEGQFGPFRSGGLIAAWPAGVAWARRGVLRVARGGGLVTVLDRGATFAKLRVEGGELRWTRDGVARSAPL